MPYAVFGMFATILLPAAIVYVVKCVDILPFRILAYFGVAVSAFVSKSIIDHGTKKATAAHIAMSTRGIVYGNLPENIKAEGYRVARYHYSYLSTSEIVRRGIGLFYRDVLKKETDWKYAKETDESFLSELGSFLAIFFASLIPYLGACTMAWEFAYPGYKLDESICDSLETFFKNWKRMLLSITASLICGLLCLLIVGTITLLICFLVFALVPGTVNVLENIIQIENISEYASYGKGGWFIFFEALAWGATFPFIIARTRIFILKQYFIGADKFPTRGILYSKYSGTIDKIKQYRENKSKQHTYKVTTGNETS